MSRYQVEGEARIVFCTDVEAKDNIEAADLAIEMLRLDGYEVLDIKVKVEEE